MSEILASGRCLCGKISYRVTGPPVWIGYCHCESCRRFTGGLVTSWLGIDAGASSPTANHPKTTSTTP